MYKLNTIYLACGVIKTGEAKLCASLCSFALGKGRKDFLNNSYYMFVISGITE